MLHWWRLRRLEVVRAESFTELLLSGIFLVFSEISSLSSIPLAISRIGLYTSADSTIKITIARSKHLFADLLPIIRILIYS